MSLKIFSILLFVGSFAIKTSNADYGGYLCNDRNILFTLSSIARTVARISDNLVAGGCLKPTTVAVDKCENLKTGNEYYLKTSDGRFVAVDVTKKLGFIRPVDARKASKFTATKVGCNLYGLCVKGLCMSRCMGCQSDTGDLQTVKFHIGNSNEPYSRWTLSSADGSGGEYNLKIDGSYGYLTYKKTLSRDDQLTLTTQLSNENKFQFVEVDELENKFYDVNLV